jgi:hypothetical protein
MKRSSVCLLISALCGIAVSTAAASQAVAARFPPEFSCVWKTEGQRDTIVRVKGQRVRLDGQTSDGMAYAIVFDNPRKTVIRWNKASDAVHSEPLDSPMPPFFFPDTLVWEFLGEEMVTGRACMKLRCRPTAGDGDEALMWVDKETRFPAKMQAKGEPAQVWADLKVGPQDEALFRPPGSNGTGRQAHGGAFREDDPGAPKRPQGRN